VSAPCNQVHAFVDGELDASQAEAFRDHLAECARCQEALRDALLMVSLEERLDSAVPLPAAGKVIPLRPHRRWRMAALAAVPLLAAAALVMVWRIVEREPPAIAAGERFRRALAPVRSIEGRLSYPGADVYREYSVMRAPDERVEEIPLDLVQTLEDGGEMRGVAAAHVLMGARTLAERKLQRAPESASTYSDRALLALDRDTEAALLLSAQALEIEPDHAPALWNRALALDRLGLSRMAAQAFEHVARLGEPGWSAEATRRARELHASADAMRATWEEGMQSRSRLVEHGELPSEAQIRATPGLLRLALYDAVRAAPSAERVRALRPLAEALDVHYGGTVLAGYVDRIAGSYPARRVELARRYAELVAADSGSARADRETADAEFVARALAEGQDDIALGSLLFTELDAPAIELYRKLALATGDPWFELLAEETAAARLLEQHDLAQVIDRATAALQRCDALQLHYRCARLEKLLAHAHGDLHNITEARRYIASGWQRLAWTRDWRYLVRFLYSRASVALNSDDSLGSQYDVAAAYLGEALLWWPDCDNRWYVARQLATVLIQQGRMDEARVQLARVTASCPERESTVALALLQAQLASAGGDDAEVSALRAELDVLRRDRPPGMRAFVDHIEGRLLLQREPETGRALLRRAIDATAELPADDIYAAKARAFGYALLAVDAASRGEHGRALALLAEEIGIAEPARCAIGIVAEQSALVVVARGPDGAPIGEHTPSRSVSGRRRALPRAPVPVRISDALRGCASVDVIARPPYAGRGALLPRDIAWRHRAARAAPPGEQGASNVLSRHLLVAGVEPPASLGLPALLPAGPSSATVELRGAAATPERVLAEMPSATLIEIHAHGIPGAGGADSSFLALSPGAGGRYALTADQVRAHRLVAAPVVLLSACRAALTPAHHHQARNLATAFLDAGARAVIASSEPVRDDHAEAFFGGVRDAIARGVAPAIALRDQRIAAEQESDHGWSDQVVAIE
jgi:hypothetical protein